jgi:hypothetical protein
MHATGVGLALFGRDQLLASEADHSRRRVVSGALRRMTAWIEHIFAKPMQ